jgi:uncharacterized protein (UPF0332 family)
MATYQTVTSEDRIEVRPHLVRAATSLRAATLLRDAGLPEDCATRAHQAAVHAERALLAVEKRSPPDIRSVHRMCTLHFLQAGKFAAPVVAGVERLVTLRHRADDQVPGIVTSDEAAQACADAEAFLRAAETWLDANGFLGAAAPGRTA